MHVLGGATVHVYETGTTTPLTQTMYTTATGSTVLSNPLTSTADGTIEFYVDTTTRADLAISKAGYNSVTITIDTGSPSGAAAGSHTHDAADVVSGSLASARLSETLAIGDLSNVSGTPAAGQTVRHNGTAMAPDGKIFSMVAYGVVSGDDDTNASANTTARNRCINAALAAGDGSVVFLDWEGTARFSTTGTVYSRLHYRGKRWNVSKLQDSATAGSHVWASESFSTRTQTVPSDYTAGTYEFSFVDHVIDGNKANNGSGGHGLAIVGYGYHLDNLTIQNCHGAGWWAEWSSTGEPIGNGGSNRQRALNIGKIWLINNDCASVAAANTRSSESRASLTTGQATIYGPGDSYFHYIECYRDGSVAGNGIYFGTIDFTAGSFNSFSPVIDVAVCWLNHTRGIYLGSDGPRIGYVHSEGASTNLEIACQGPFINAGRLFLTRASGTSLKISSGGNGGKIHLNLENDTGASVTKLDVTGATLSEAELCLYIDCGSAVAVTLTNGSLPTGCREIDITASNWGGATVTAGFIPVIPIGGTTYRLVRRTAPVGVQGGATLHSGSGAPSDSMGSNGDYYFRTGTPSTTNQRLYVRSSGAWTGIL